MKQLLNLFRSNLAVATAASLLFTSTAPAQQKAAGPGKVSGTVLETTNASSYTYVQIDTGKEKLWAAAPQFDAKVGDKVSFADGMPMENFHSKALGRTFKTVYFVNQIDAPGAKASSSSGALPNDDVHAAFRKPAPKAAPTEFSGLKKPQGGLTIAEIYQQKGKLENKPVLFRGKVVKYNPQVMNKNWLHVQDGTGNEQTRDITVTTLDSAAVGDTVLIKGTVVLKKDFGYGYKYDLMVENAKVTVD